jgi:hypothetical protein
LPLPKISLNEQSGAGRRYEASGDPHGQFRLAGVESGVYTIRITVQGFRDKTVSGVHVAPGQQTDLGVVALEIAGCDAPGVICDDFGLSVYEDPIHAQGIIEIPQLCAVDINEGHWRCRVNPDGRGVIPPLQDPDSDFWIREGNSGTIWLAPRNGAGLALNPPTTENKSGCISASYSTKEVRIDGLPLGSRVCIHTNLGRYAEVTFTEVVKPKAEKVKAAFITWQGARDGSQLQDARHQ